MADIRINALATTAASTASDDFIAVDGSANGTRKLNAYSPTFGGNVVATGTLTVNSTTDSSSKDTGAIVTEGGLGVEKSASIGGNLTVSGTTNVSGGSATSSSSALNLSGAYGGGIGFADTKYSNIFVSNSGAHLNFVTNLSAASGFNPSAVDFKLTSSSATFAGNLTVSGTGQSSVGGYLSINSALAGSTYGRIILGTTTGGVPALFATNAADASLAIDFPSASIARIRTNSGAEVMAFAIGTTEAARFHTNGNLLIGTTTDGGQKLQVSGTAYVSGNTTIGGTLYVDKTTPTIELRQGGAAQAQFYTFNGELTIQTNTAKQIALATNGTTALTLDSSQNATFAGNVTIGSTAVSIYANQINGYTNLNSDNVDLWINYSGYQNGATRYRDTRIGDGKNGQIVEFIGSTKAATFAGSIAIGNTVNTVSPTSPNRTITMVIGGTTYYIHAKTTND